MMQLAAATAALASLAFAACGDRESSRPSRTSTERQLTSGELVNRARNFREFLLYYLGRSYDGLRLTAAEKQYAFLFVYGDCEVDEDPDHPSCVPPFQMQVYRIDKYPSFDFFTRAVAASTERGALIVETTHRAPLTTHVFFDELAVDVDVVGSAAHRFVEALRPVRGRARLAVDLPRPRLPGSVMRALERTVQAYKRLGNEASVASRLRVKRLTVRSRLKIARALRLLRNPG